MVGVLHGMERHGGSNFPIAGVVVIIARVLVVILIVRMVVITLLHQ